MTADDETPPGRLDNEDLSRFGYDPLDDIKPIDADDYKKSKDDTFSAPILDPEDIKKNLPKAAPISKLEDSPKRVAREGLATETPKELVFKNDYCDLLKRDPTMRQIMIGAGWEQRAFDRDPIDMDLSCFLIDKTDMTREDSDFVFYNNPVGCNGAVKLMDDSRGGGGEGDDEQIFIDLNGLPFDVIRIVFTLTIYDQQLKGHYLSHLRDVYLRVYNYEDGNEIARFIIPEDDLVDCNGMVAAMMVREGPQWFLQPLAEKSVGGLAPIAKKYGLLIAEEGGG